MLRRVVVGERGAGRFGRADVVVDRTLDPGDGSGEREVMREVGDVSIEVRVPLALQRLPDSKVQLGSADGGDAVVEGSSDELVSEPVRRPVL